LFSHKLFHKLMKPDLPHSRDASARTN
jgi:hypothetical protein